MSYELKVKSFIFPSILAFCFLITISCREKSVTYSGYSKQNKFYYKLLSIGDGKTKTDSTQTLWIDVACSTLKDSVFWDSKHNSTQRLFVNKESFSFLKHLYNFSSGDSLQYLFQTKNFFSVFFKSPVPFFCEKDSCIKFSVKILRVLNENEMALFKDSLLFAESMLQKNEFLEIQNYVTKNFKKAIGIAPNTFMEITHTTSLDSVKTGKHIKMLYKGSYLNGRVVDSSPNNWAFEFIYGQEGQIVEGLHIALRHLKMGEKAKIILPSQLAFGSGGSSNGSITPYTPLLYEVEILDVK